MVATDGETAIDQTEYATPDLILLDVIMPVMDGFETCRRLKSNPATNEIPVIFMTALNDTVDKIKGLSLGAVDYITKPFQTEEVLARLQVHLQLHFLTKQLEDQNLYLEERVAERTADLQQANQQLRELEAQLRKALAQEQEFNHLKSRMIIAISHEYRTPLTSILSSSELLEAYCHRWDKSKQSQHFQRIREAVQRITDLMGNVMFLNKAEFE
ncbi:response regulator, partial [Moorena sp. SIO3F7]